MSAAHLHIVFAHVPAIAIFFGLLILVLSLVKSHADLFRASLVVFVLAGAVAVLVYLLGEPAEEIVEDMAGISHDLIHEHEEAALYALISGITLGVVSLFGLWLSRSSVPKWFQPVVLVLALLALSIVAVTANRGGQINHPEIRSSMTPPTGGIPHDDDDED